MKWRFWSSLLLSLSLLSCGSFSSQPTLRLFTWSGFLMPELVADFERRFNCRLLIDIYDSNESMYAKLKLGGSRYDLIFPSSYYLDILEKQGMVQSIDEKQVPNVRNLDPRYLMKKGEKGELMAVPFLISFSGIAYRQDRIDSIDPSWRIFGDHRYRGRMTMLNDAREALGAALKALGHTINTIDDLFINQAADLLIDWKQNLAKFESEQYKNGIASAEFLIVQGYSMDIMQVREEDEGVEFLFPQEGAILSIDSIAIPKDALNAELAHSFINFMLEPKIAAKNMEHANSLIPIPESYSHLPERFQKSAHFFPSEEQLKKMELIEDVGGEASLYYRAWERVKAS